MAATVLLIQRTFTNKVKNQIRLLPIGSVCSTNHGKLVSIASARTMVLNYSVVLFYDNSRHSSPAILNLYMCVCLCNICGRSDESRGWF